MISDYRNLRHNAITIEEVDGYDLSKGEMNPGIAMQFAEICADAGFDTVWEPFANPDGRTFDIFYEVNLCLTATSLMAEHDEIQILDCTVDSPGWEFDGILFHPPYFGSAPFSDDIRDLSNMEEEEEWLVMMESSAEVAMEHLHERGIICAVGRRYRHGGKEIKMDEWLIHAFDGMEPFEVWISNPDVAILMRKKK